MADRTPKRSFAKTASVLIATVLFAGLAAAQAPQYVRFQARLADAGGVVVEDGTYDVTVRVYDVPSGGDELVTRVFPVTPVRDGQVNLVIDLQGDGFDSNDFEEGSTLYLGITVNEPGTGANIEMTPRHRLTPAFYAIRATTVLDNRITTEKLAASAVTSEKILDQSVTSLKLAEPDRQFGLPIGGVVAWTGAIATIPTGYELCNGEFSNALGRNKPNLMGMFPKGVPAGGVLGTTGGGGVLFPGGATGSTTLTEDHWPEHTHLKGSLTTTGNSPHTHSATNSGMACTSDANGNLAYTLRRTGEVHNLPSGSDSCDIKDGDHSHTMVTGGIKGVYLGSTNGNPHNHAVEPESAEPKHQMLYFIIRVM
jgi:hypothetical protein